MVRKKHSFRTIQNRAVERQWKLRNFFSLYRKRKGARVLLKKLTVTLKRSIIFFAAASSKPRWKYDPLRFLLLNRYLFSKGNKSHPPDTVSNKGATLSQKVPRTSKSAHLGGNTKRKKVLKSFNGFNESKRKKKEVADPTRSF
jgi:hypothetical protein